MNFILLPLTETRAPHWGSFSHSKLVKPTGHWPGGNSWRDGRLFEKVSKIKAAWWSGGSSHGSFLWVITHPSYVCGLYCPHKNPIYKWDEPASGEAASRWSAGYIPRLPRVRTQSRSHVTWSCPKMGDQVAKVRPFEYWNPWWLGIHHSKNPPYEFHMLKSRSLAHGPWLDKPESKAFLLLSMTGIPSASTWNSGGLDGGLGRSRSIN